MLLRALPVLHVAFVLMTFVSTFLVDAGNVTGRIVKIDEGSITIKDNDGKSLTFRVDLEAKITLDGKPVKLLDLKAGASADIATEMRGNQSVAISITAKTTANPDG